MTAVKTTWHEMGYRSRQVRKQMKMSDHRVSPFWVWSIEKRNGVWAWASVSGEWWLSQQHVSDIWWCSTAVTMVTQIRYFVCASCFDKKPIKIFTSVKINRVTCWPYICIYIYNWSYLYRPQMGFAYYLSSGIYMWFISANRCYFMHWQYLYFHGNNTQ